MTWLVWVILGLMGLVALGAVLEWLSGLAELVGYLRSMSRREWVQAAAGLVLVIVGFLAVVATGEQVGDEKGATVAIVVIGAYIWALATIRGRRGVIDKSRDEGERAGAEIALRIVRDGDDWLDGQGWREDSERPWLRDSGLLDRLLRETVEGREETKRAAEREREEAARAAEREREAVEAREAEKRRRERAAYERAGELGPGNYDGVIAFRAYEARFALELFRWGHLGVSSGFVREALEEAVRRHDPEPTAKQVGKVVGARLRALPPQEVDARRRELDERRREAHERGREAHERARGVKKVRGAK